jgi:glucose/arabinose dehydrogenase
VHPRTGGVFGADNGPATGDELSFLQAGRNFEWGAPLGFSFGAATGFTMRRWDDVVVPTGLAFHGGAGLGEAFADDLLMTLYDSEEVLRLDLSGEHLTEIDAESALLRFAPRGIDNKPLHVAVGPEGDVWVTTFTAIYRVYRP